MLQSPFSPDWPRYAIAAHIVFWTASGVFLVSCLGGFAGIVGGGIIIGLLWSFIASAFLLGLAATFSGRLYVGNQVFRGTPTTGWLARLMGMLVAGSSALLMSFADALLFWGRF